MTDAGRITRRALLGGAAGAVAVLGGGTLLGHHELQAHPSLREHLFGCGRTPALPPRGAYPIVTGTSLPSTAMRRTMPYAVTIFGTADPGGRPPSAPLPLILALPGEGGSATDFADRLGLPNYADAAGLEACIVSPGDVGSSYYHPRSDGSDMLSFLLDELVPHVEQEHGVGGSRARRGVYGLSMGGFGALLIAQQRPAFACAVAAASPAVFPSYEAAVTGHRGTFDSAAQWEQYGVWDHLSSMGRVPVRIDCGDSDPFANTAKELIERIPGAVGHIGSGCHDIGFWRRAAPADFAFLKNHLSS